MLMENSILDANVKNTVNYFNQKEINISLLPKDCNSNQKTNINVLSRTDLNNKAENLAVKKTNEILTVDLTNDANQNSNNQFYIIKTLQRENQNPIIFQPFELLKLRTNNVQPLKLDTTNFKDKNSSYNLINKNCLNNQKKTDLNPLNNGTSAVLQNKNQLKSTKINLVSNQKLNKPNKNPKNNIYDNFLINTQQLKNNQIIEINDINLLASNSKNINFIQKLIEYEDYKKSQNMKESSQTNEQIINAKKISSTTQNTTMFEKKDIDLIDLEKDDCEIIELDPTDYNLSSNVSTATITSLTTSNEKINSLNKNNNCLNVNPQEKHEIINENNRPNQTLKNTAQCPEKSPIVDFAYVSDSENMNSSSLSTCLKCKSCLYLTLDFQKLKEHELKYCKYENEISKIKCLGCSNNFNEKRAYETHLIYDHLVALSEIDDIVKISLEKTKEKLKISSAKNYDELVKDVLINDNAVCECDKPIECKRNQNKKETDTEMSHQIKKNFENYTNHKNFKTNDTNSLPINDEILNNKILIQNENYENLSNEEHHFSTIDNNVLNCWQPKDVKFQCNNENTTANENTNVRNKNSSNQIKVLNCIELNNKHKKACSSQIKVLDCIELNNRHNKKYPIRIAQHLFDHNPQPLESNNIENHSDALNNLLDHSVNLEINSNKFVNPSNYVLNDFQNGQFNFDPNNFILGHESQNYQNYKETNFQSNQNIDLYSNLEIFNYDFEPNYEMNLPHSIEQPVVFDTNMLNQQNSMLNQHSIDQHNKTLLQNPLLRTKSIDQSNQLNKNDSLIINSSNNEFLPIDEQILSTQELSTLNNENRFVTEKLNELTDNNDDKLKTLDSLQLFDYLGLKKNNDGDNMMIDTTNLKIINNLNENNFNSDSNTEISILANKNFEIDQNSIIYNLIEDNDNNAILNGNFKSEIAIQSDLKMNPIINNNLFGNVIVMEDTNFVNNGKIVNLTNGNKNLTDKLEVAIQTTTKNLIVSNNEIVNIDTTNNNLNSQNVIKDKSQVGNWKIHLEKQNTNEKNQCEENNHFQILGNNNFIDLCNETQQKENHFKKNTNETRKNFHVEIKKIDKINKELLDSKNKKISEVKDHKYVKILNQNLSSQHLEKDMNNKKTNEESFGNKAEAKKSSIIEQQILVKKAKIFTCRFKNCHVKMEYQSNIDYHFKCHKINAKTFICIECQKEFAFWSTLIGHLWREHKINLELYKCEQCEFRTSSLYKLNTQHRPTHSDLKPFHCDKCVNTFKNLKQLLNHKLIRHKVKEPIAFKCHYCNREFNKKHNLKVHQMNVHLKEKKEQCRYCDYKTGLKSTLKIHERSKHTHIKPYHCKYCDYSSSDHNSMRRHKSRHTGNFKYSCTLCSYTCIQISAYKMHMNLFHPNEMNQIFFSCNLCSFKTLRKELFETHTIYKHSNNNNNNIQFLKLIDQSKLMKDIN